MPCRETWETCTLPSLRNRCQSVQPGELGSSLEHSGDCFDVGVANGRDLLGTVGDHSDDRVVAANYNDSSYGDGVLGENDSSDDVRCVPWLSKGVEDSAKTSRCPKLDVSL